MDTKNKSPQIPKLNKKISLLLPVLLCALLVGSLFLTKSHYERIERQRLEQSFSQAAVWGTTQLNLTMSSLARQVEYVGLEVSQSVTDKTQTPQLPPEHLAASQAAALAIFDENGQLIYGDSTYAPIYTGFSQFGSSSYSRMVSDITLCKDGKYYFGMSSSFTLEDGSGISIMLLFPSSVLREAVNIRLFDPQVSICVLRSDSSDVFGSDSLPWQLSPSQSEQFIFSAHSGLYSFCSASDGKQYLALGAPAGIRDWTVACVAPESILTRRITLVSAPLYIFSAIALLVLLVLTTFDRNSFRYLHIRHVMEREKFRIALRQTSGAAFEYNSATDSFSFISQCDRLTLPYGQGSITMHHLLELIHPADREPAAAAIKVFNEGGYFSASVRISGLSPSGEYRWYHISAKHLSIKDIRSRLTIGTIEDIDEVERERISLRQKATTDFLTGLWNRAETEHIINERLSVLAPDESSTFAILDIDDFKDVNDCYGHDCGDSALVTFAEKLQSTFRLGDIIGRLGGDEFVVYMAFTADQEVVTRRLRELGEGLLRRRHDDTSVPELTCSVGYVTARQGDSFETVYKRADTALYKAKQLGKGQACSGD